MRETKAKTKTKKMNHETLLFLLTLGGAIGTILLGVIGFFLVRLVNSIDSMAKNIHEIKITLVLVSTKHEGFEDDLAEQKERLQLIYDKVFA